MFGYLLMIYLLYEAIKTA